MQNKRTIDPVRIFGLLLSVGILMVGILIMQKTIRQRISFKATEGRVVGIETSKDFTTRGATIDVFSPQVSFILLSNNKTVVFTEPTRSYPSPYDVGDKVKVLYDPSNPTDARVYAWWSLYLLPISLIVIGGAVSILMIGILLGKIDGGE
jgi:hypothetical protein